MATLDVYGAIGSGYEDAWFSNCHARYRAFKGGRNTKKSTDIGGIEPLIKVLSDPNRNVIMCRQNDVDNADSTYANLVYWINALGLGHLFKCTTSPYKITRKATGQVIVFRGCNNPTSVTSIKPVTGMYTDVYFEEASELKSYEDFRKIDGSIRGQCPEGTFLQITFLFNAWDIGHWLYDLLFKGRLEDDVTALERDGYQFAYFPDFNLGFGKGLALHISTYRINEFRSPDYDEGMSELKRTAYNIYLVEGLGCWGNTMDGVYPNWDDGLIIPQSQAEAGPYSAWTIGVDTGLSDGNGKIAPNGEVGSAMAMTLKAVTADMSALVTVAEYYDTNEGRRVKKTSAEYQTEMISTIRKWMERMRWLNGGVVYVDCADIGFRQMLELEARRQGLFGWRFEKSTKLKVHNRITIEDRLMAFGEFRVSSSCKDLIREIKDAHRGPKGEWRADTNDHAITADEYAWAPLAPMLRRWKDFKLER